MDRHELYVAFSFTVNLKKKPEKLISSEEGIMYWVDKDTAMEKDNVFPLVKYYYQRILNDEPGILYNYSEWNDNQFVEHIVHTSMFRH